MEILKLILKIIGAFFLWLVVLVFCITPDTRVAGFVLAGMILTYYILRLFIFNSGYIKKKERDIQEEISKLEINYSGS